MEQADTGLRRLDAEMRILATDRDAAVDQSAQLTRELDDSRARAERLRAQVRTLVSPQQSVQGMSERMRQPGTREILSEQAKEQWQDVKSAEFERKYLDELISSVDAAMSTMDQLNKVLAKMKADCE